MKSISYATILLSPIAVPTWARCPPTIIKLDTRLIQYHSRQKPNALICFYTADAKNNLLKKSRETWIHPDAHAPYTFHYPPHHIDFKSTKTIRKNVLECDVRVATMVPGMLIHFTCYDVKPNSNFSVFNGFLNGNCVPHYY